MWRRGSVGVCVASDGGERCGRDMSEDVKKGRGVGVSVVLTYAPVASSWVEKVRVESIWFGHLLQMVANTADL